MLGVVVGLCRFFLLLLLLGCGCWLGFLVCSGWCVVVSC